MPRHLRGVLLVYATTLIATAQAQVREHDIDLLTRTDSGTPTPVPIDKRLTLAQPLLVSSHDPKPPESALVVLAPQLDRATYQWGDPFVCVWVLENRGKEPVAFPTLTADDRVARDMPGATMAAVFLRFVDDRAAGELVGAQALYGAESVPGSLLVVQPGERARIRGKGTWSLMGISKITAASSAGAYQVKATAHVMRQGGRNFSTESVAALTISLRERD